jgi:polyribonucleotide nucleotidyltransferase
MNASIAAPRDEVAETAPKIISFNIPLDKIGEVIGPKGKVINTIQAETGADIAVDDDGVEGTVTIGSTDSGAVAEAKRQIELIVNPPLAKVGEIYPGRVVNITKFGAFVNILPGRDGLVHISKLGKGKRINNVEDVLELGQELDVKVDDIDPNGKVSLSPAGDEWAGSGGGAASGGSSSSGAPAADGAPTASFEDSFDAEMRETFGDLGPTEAGRPAGGGDRGGDRGRGGPRRNDRGRGGRG